MSLLTEPVATSTIAATAVRILGLGTAIPPTLPQSHVAELVERICCHSEQQRAWARMILDRSGVRRRGSVLLTDIDIGDSDGHEAVRSLMDRFYPPPNHETDRGPTTAQRMRLYAQHAPSLAAAAARGAFENAGLPASAITHLICVSCTGFFAPGLDAALIAHLQLASSVRRLQVGFMGCHGAFNALTAARSIAASDPTARVLVCCVELCSLHLAYGWDPQKIVANALFADGAAAAIVGQKRQSSPSSPSRLDAWPLRDTASCLLPASADAMTWIIGNHGYEMTLSPRLPELIRTHLRPWILSWLERCHLSPADIRSWAVHPGGPKVLSAVTDSLGLPVDAVQPSREILANCGNMSSATILFILNNLLHRHARGPCVAIGFGPGLMVEGMLLG
jgi:predicted naringenin-chalcone synthase